MAKSEVIVAMFYLINEEQKDFMKEVFLLKFLDIFIYLKCCLSYYLRCIF